MKQRIYIFALCLALLLAGCSGGNEETAPPLPSTQEELRALYTDAAHKLQAAQDLTLQIETETSITLGSERFTKHSVQQLSLSGVGTNEMCGSMDEVLTVGTHKSAITEQFENGSFYFTVNGSRFTASMTAATYLARYVPAAALDASLYNKITATNAGKQCIIDFSEPTAPEYWAVPAEARLVAASGQALLTENGDISCCRYSVAYTCASASLEQATTVTVSDNFKAPGSVDSSTRWLPLEAPDAPRLLEEACGYLTQAQAISSRATEQIVSEAFGLSRIQTTQLDMHGIDESLLALRQTDVSLTNHSRGDETTKSLQVEKFIDGHYTLEKEGIAADAGDITPQQMRTYCQELLVSSILLPEYIQSVQVHVGDGTIRLEFTASEELAAQMVSNACQSLYSDPALLSQLATDYFNEAMTAYLEIDKYTGLPISSGIYCKGVHTIQTTAYALTTQMDQTYIPASDSALDTITKGQ